jgi:hypothetical protein
MGKILLNRIYDHAVDHGRVLSGASSKVVSRLHVVPKAFAALAIVPFHAIGLRVILISDRVPTDHYLKDFPEFV